MVALGSMQKALINAGLAEMPKERKPRKGKTITCRSCGKPMDKIVDSNIAVCRHCDKKLSYIVFSN